jgi:hypothetical protein
MPNAIDTLRDLLTDYDDTPPPALRALADVEALVAAVERVREFQEYWQMMTPEEWEVLVAAAKKVRGDT